ncbi:hypothetical protein AURDEDRAFT_169980 [Auricularia subglabra TFB-10046 SS5]|uniref:MFS general substrate transporter n=1 Tax=Auricularia subglabra (strain TFB-10046 / SS5) TaxID=717982 RepID=J0WX37_AURST|nr:hypothetical protein AURDEDRAFT_169980 [Auricularia subglabra TFB-10046 SS5]
MRTSTPSNIILRRLRPSLYIPSLKVVWGIVCALFAVIHSPSALLAIRFFLGLAEAGFLPGAPGTRGICRAGDTAVFYPSVSLTGAFEVRLIPLYLSARIHLPVRRWIFIVEGATTARPGLLAFVFRADYPISASWLLPREKALIERANTANRVLHATEPFELRRILSAFSDWRTYLWGIFYLSCTAGGRATLMACPPYAVGFVLVLPVIAGYTADRTGHRFVYYVVGIVVTMIALIVLMTVEALHMPYGFL